MLSDSEWTYLEETPLDLIYNILRRESTVLIFWLVKIKREKEVEREFYV